MWSIANGPAVPAPLGYAVERRGLCRAVCGFQLQRAECVSVELQCELDELPPVPHLPTHTPRLPPHSNAHNPTSTPYSITPHSASSSASVHNTPALGLMPLRLLYAYGSSCEWDSQSGESTDEEQCVVVSFPPSNSFPSPIHLPFSLIYQSASLSSFDITNYFCLLVRRFHSNSLYSLSSTPSCLPSPPNLFLSFLRLDSTSVFDDFLFR